MDKGGAERSLLDLVVGCIDRTELLERRKRGGGEAQSDIESG